MKKNLIYLTVSLLLTSCIGGGSGGQDLIPLYDGTTYLYFDGKGKVAVKPEMNVEETATFSTGLAPAGIKTDDGMRFGFLNMKGEMAIHPKYIRATMFSDGLAWVAEPNGAPKAINTRGEEVFSMLDAEHVMLFSEGVAPFAKAVDGELLFGYVDKKGKVVIEPVYQLAMPFSSGLASVVEKGGKWGYINHKGEMAIAAQFATGSSFTPEGYAVAAMSNNLYGAIDKKGTFTINPKYQEVRIDGGRFIVKENNKFSIIDKKGNVLVQPEFKDILPFNGYPHTIASLDGASYGIIDRKGKFTVNPQFGGGAPFVGNIALVILGSKYGLVDVQGKYVVNPTYEKTIGDLSRYIMLESDYLDMESIVNTIGGNYINGTFFGISAPSTYGSVKSVHPTLSANYYGSEYTSGSDTPLSADVYLNSVIFTFKGPVSKREYNYYDRKYETKDLNPAVRTAEYEFSFRNEKARKKAGDISDAVGNELAGHFTDGSATVNVRKSGNSIRVKITY
jgi:hypothetical protein